MISNFDDLLQAARAQAQPQRLLMVFVAAELPDEATPQQQAEFEAGQGGALAPLMCVDKSPDEIDSFAQLCVQADGVHSGWRVVLAGALSGTQGQAPSNQAVDDTLQRWLGQIQAGRVDQVLAQTLAFTRDGMAVPLQA
jgi:hypothetical protein